MAGWTDIIDGAQTLLNSGRPQDAIQLYDRGLRTYGADPAAKGWLGFNLLLCEATHSGYASAYARLRDVSNSSIPWNAKLYALEAVLAVAPPDTARTSGLFADTLAILDGYVAADIGPQDINIISCQTISSHAERLFGPSSSPHFERRETDQRFPCIETELSVSPPLPMPGFCNRLPRAVALAFEHQAPPLRPLGFRHVGPAYLLRLGNNTIAFDKNGTVLDTPYGPFPAFLKAIIEKHFKTLRCTRTESRASLFVGDFFSHSLNYCHWLLDNMTRVVAATKAALPFTRLFGAFELTAAFQEQTLQRLLDTGQSYRSVTADEGLIACEDFYYADNAGPRYIRHPVYGCDQALLHTLRDRLMSGMPAPARRRRLYVPRRHNRTVLNEAEVVAKLAVQGFEVIDTDAMTFEAQMEAFAAAEAVVAPHGAALSNLLFAPADCKVLEFFPPFGGSSTFYSLSGGRSQDYSCYIDDISQGPNRDLASGVVNNTAGIHVDPGFLQDWLDAKYAGAVL